MINYIKEKQIKILIISIITYITIFSLICYWKYLNFGYNGLDLTIFNQVFFNSVHGDFFRFTIHPGLYLGDHFTPIILLLLPLYYFFQSPITLLILQTIILALSAWPIYLIAKKYLPSAWPLFISLAWLFNPFVQNVNLFEFHLLPFAIFLIFWTFYFYLKNNFNLFLLFSLLSMLVREDVALVIIMMAVLALFEKRKWFWFIIPGVISIIYFLTSMSIIGHFTPDGQYKFLYYYNFLGNSFKEIIITALTKPWLIIKQIASWHNLFFTLTLFMPFAYLLRLKYLIPAFLIYLQLIIGSANDSVLVLSMHYVSLLLPPIFIAFIMFLNRFLLTDNYLKLKSLLQLNNSLFILILSTIVLYSSLTMGPLPSVAKNLISPGWSEEKLLIKKELVKNISPSDNLGATYEFLSPMSSRHNLYSMHYAFLGKLQFSNTDYELPLDVDTLLIDFNDFIYYELQYPDEPTWQSYYQKGDDSIRKLIEERSFGITKINDLYVLMKKDVNNNIKLYEIVDDTKFDEVDYKKIGENISFLGYENNLDHISLYFKSNSKLNEDYQIRLIGKNNNEEVFNRYLPLAYGLYPTREWGKDEIIKINYYLNLKDVSSLELNLVNLQGYYTLNNLGTMINKITQENTLGYVKIDLD